MSYLDERDKVSITDYLKQASRRIDGIAMYIVCTFFVLISFYLFLAGQFDWFLPLDQGKIILMSLLLAFITFLSYVWLDTFSTSGKLARIINSLILLAIPIITAYKLNIF